MMMNVNRDCTACLRLFDRAHAGESLTPAVNAEENRQACIDHLAGKVLCNLHRSIVNKMIRSSRDDRRM